MAALHTTTGRWRLGLALAAGATVLWAALAVALKIVVAEMAAETVIWYRYALAAVALGAYLRARRLLPSVGRLGRSGAVLFAIAVAGFCGNNVLFLMGLSRVTPSAAQAVIQLAPAFVLLGGVVVYREPFSRRQWLGFGVLLFGLALFFNQDLGKLLSGWTAQGAGLLLVVVAAALWAAYALAQKQLLRRFPSASIMWMIYILGVVLLLPLAKPAQALQLDGVRLAALVFCSLNTIFAYGCFAESLAHLEATRVSAVLATGPLLTVGFAALAARLLPDHIQPESLNATSVAGAACVVCGTVLSAVIRRSRRPTAG